MVQTQSKAKSQRPLPTPCDVVIESWELKKDIARVAFMIWLYLPDPTPWMPAAAPYWLSSRQMNSSRSSPSFNPAESGSP